MGRRIQTDQHPLQKADRGMLARLAQRRVGHPLDLPRVEIPKHARAVTDRSADRQSQPPVGRPAARVVASLNRTLVGRRVSHDQQHGAGPPAAPLEVPLAHLSLLGPAIAGG